MIRAAARAPLQPPVSMLQEWQTCSRPAQALLDQVSVVSWLVLDRLGLSPAMTAHLGTVLLIPAGIRVGSFDASTHLTLCCGDHCPGRVLVLAGSRSLGASCTNARPTTHLVQHKAGRRI